jgi:hypothetical protein
MSPINSSKYQIKSDYSAGLELKLSLILTLLAQNKLRSAIAITKTGNQTAYLAKSPCPKTPS